MCFQDVSCRVAGLAGDEEECDDEDGDEGASGEVS